MNNRIDPEMVALETARFFMIMSGLAAAKAGNDAEALAEWVDELDAMAMHSSLPVLAKRCKAEADQARGLMAEKIEGMVLAFSRPADHAPLN